jgi:hypothetical protein
MCSKYVCHVCVCTTYSARTTGPRNDRMRKDDLPGMVFLRKVEELMTRALSGLCLNSSFGFPEQVGTGQSLNHNHKRNFVIFYLRNCKTFQSLEVGVAFPSRFEVLGIFRDSYWQLGSSRYLCIYLTWIASIPRLRCNVPLETMTFVTSVTSVTSESCRCRPVLSSWRWCKIYFRANIRSAVPAKRFRLWNWDGRMCHTNMWTSFWSINWSPARQDGAP